MGLIEDELSEVRKLCEHKIAGSKLVSCVQTMVRVEIRRTDFKHVIACIQFPEEYPKAPLLIELKSKTLSDKLLTGLTTVLEQETKKHLGKPQILQVLIFLRNFIDENPLSCCYDEINALKKSLDGTGDELKLRQKSSSLQLKLTGGRYRFESKLLIPDDYPTSRVTFENVETNFPPAFCRHMVAQTEEIARKCVEAPLKPKKNEPPFRPGPSLHKAVSFLIDCVKRLPQENCQHCKKSCLPQDPSQAVTDENSPQHVERVLCGHLFHLECFFAYMKKPPFDNKKCETCGRRIHHHKWSLSDKLAEDRWAHEQARNRELAEVEDFFK